MTRNKDFRKKHRAMPRGKEVQRIKPTSRAERGTQRKWLSAQNQKGNEMTAKTTNPTINEEYYVIQVPMRTIRDAISELEAHQASWFAWEAEREKWVITPEVEAQGGFQKVKEHKRELEAIDAKQQERVNQARTRIADLRTECSELIDEQVTPRGADILGDNEEDFALIKNGLIDRPEHLRAIVDKHNNAAFRNAAQDYAAEKKREAENPNDAEMWEGFAYKAKEKSVRDYCTQMFDLFDRAASQPQGVAMMQALEETEPIRAAKAYGVVDCLPSLQRD